jgi:hypothetical protein
MRVLLAPEAHFRILLILATDVVGNHPIARQFPWPPEIELIAQRFGETFLQVMEAALDTGMEPTLLVIGDLRLPCKVRLRAGLSSPPFAVDYVALRPPGQRVVVPSSGFTMTACEVDLLLMQRHQPVPDRTRHHGDH